MAKCKTAVTPLLTHWSYCSLAPSPWYISLILKFVYDLELEFMHAVIQGWDNGCLVTFMIYDLMRLFAVTKCMAFKCNHFLPGKSWSPRDLQLHSPRICVNLPDNRPGLVAMEISSPATGWAGIKTIGHGNQWEIAEGSPQGSFDIGVKAGLGTQVQG